MRTYTAMCTLCRKHVAKPCETEEQKRACPLAFALGTRRRFKKWQAELEEQTQRVLLEAGETCGL